MAWTPAVGGAAPDHEYDGDDDDRDLDLDDNGDDDDHDDYGKSDCDDDHYGASIENFDNKIILKLVCFHQVFDLG